MPAARWRPAIRLALLTVQGNLVFMAASSYMVEVSPDNADRTNVTGIATLGGATVNAHFAAGSYIARQYTILNATGGLGGSTFNALANTDLPANFQHHLELRRQQRLSQPDPELRGAVWAQSQSAERRQRADELLQQHRRHSAGVRRAVAAGTDAGVRRDRDRHAADHVRCDDPVHGRDDRSVRRRTRRCGSAFGGATRIRRRDRRAPMRQQRKPNDALAAIYRKAPPMRAFLRATLERVGGGLRRFADHRRQCRRRIEHRDLAHLRHRRRRRLSLLARYAGRFCARRRRHQLLHRQRRLRALRPVPGRRLHASHMSVRPISPRHSPTAGRTSPPIAPSPSPASISCARSSTPMPSPAASKAATASSRRSWGSRLTPPAQFTTFDLPAYAEQALSAPTPSR